MPFEYLWNEWRSEYVSSLGSDSSGTRDGGSLFERILAASDDAETGVVHRGEHCFVLLNRYPYTSGHSMVLPNRAVDRLDGLTPAEFHELWHLVDVTVKVTDAAFSPNGMNVGLNLGRAAGGSQSDHLHVHVVPRWIGDANFMTVVGEVRTMPMSLNQARQRLIDHWPTDSAGVT